MSRVESDRRRLGVSPSDYAQMLVEQDNCCAICGAEPTTRALAVDHDHATGRVRGLLCGRCNVGLGMFEDNPVLMGLAISYLNGEDPETALDSMAAQWLSDMVAALPPPIKFRKRDN